MAVLKVSASPLMPCLLRPEAVFAIIGCSTIVTQMVCIPCWQWLTSRNGKYNAYLIQTLLLMIVIAGLSAVTTILGLLLPAVWSLQMLCTGLDASAATAMPLYWIIFTGLLMLEDIGLMAWVPLYWLLKPLALISLWGFQGAAILVPLVSK